MIDPYKVKYYETEVKTFWQTHKNEIFLWGGIALVLICVAIFYVKCGHDIPVKGITKPDVIIKKEVQKVVDSKKVDSLEKVILNIDKDRIILQSKLSAAWKHNKELIAKGIDSIPLTGYQIAPAYYSDHTKDDYIQQLQDGAYTSDSLCNEVTKQWVDLSEVKDSTIKVLKGDKNILISSFNDQGYNSTMKDKTIKSLNQSLRFKKVEVGVLVGVLIYTAVKIATKK